MTREIVIDPITRLEATARLISSWTRRATSRERSSKFRSYAALRSSLSVVLPKICPDHVAHLRGLSYGASHGGDQALDDLYKVEPPSAAKKIREMVYSAFFVEDHALHFFFLGGPDFVVGPTAPKA
jgi:F420-non-reducing hydrogenase large subunit